MIEYPAELPYPDLSGYALEHAPNLSRTEMVSGRARQRQRYTSVPSFVTLSWGMPQKEFELFEAWFRWDLKDGAEWFTGWAQTGGPGKQTVMRFVGSNSAPPYMARMNGPDYWKISCRLEIREKQTFTEGWQHLPQYILFPSILDLALNREWPEFAFDYATYAEALADLENLATGDVITIRADETQGGQPSSYEAYVTPPSTLILDFANSAYYVYDKTSTLTLVTVWAQ